MIFSDVITGARWLVLLGGLLLPGQLLAQKPKAAARPAVKKPAALVFPVSPQTHRIIYRDTIEVAGATAAALTSRFVDTYHGSFSYADYNLLTPGDTTHQLRPRQPAEPGETATVGTVLLGRAEEMPVLVAGVTPPEAYKYAPPIRYLHFTIRFRAEPGRAYVTITDLYQRSTTVRQEMARQYGLDVNDPTGKLASPPPRLPASTPVEALYWSWLPASAKAAIKHQQPASEPVPTSADAQLVVSAVQRIRRGLRFRLAQQ